MKELLLKSIATDFVAIDLIVPYEGNTKIHPREQLKLISESIETFGFNNPILIDDKNVIIAGHGRWMAAKELRLEKVTVIRLLHLNEAEKKAYRIADNKLTELGKWDTDLLGIEFDELQKLSLDFSLELTGFNTTEIDIILDDSLADKKITPDKLANAVPYIPVNEIVTVIGDVWLLDKHKIICGNSVEEASIKKLMGDKLANMIFIDPPYNVPIDKHVCGSGKIKHQEFAIGSGEMSSEAFTEFLSTAFEQLKTHSVEGALHYICMDWRHIKEIIIAGKNVYDKLLNLCIWNKSNGGMGSLYRSKHELVFIFKNGNSPHINNVELGKNGRYRTNVWDYAGVNAFGPEQDNLKMHPTVKPVEMVRDAILDVTKRGDIILDAFLGSGTTLIATEKIGRTCYGMELEPLYVDTAIRRFQKVTGIVAIHKKTGKTYDEMLKVKIESDGGSS